MTQKSDTHLGKMTSELAIPGRIGALKAPKHLDMHLYNFWNHITRLVRCDYLLEDVVLVNVAIVLIERSGVGLKAGLFTPIVFVIFVRVTVIVLAHGGGHLR